MEETSSLSNSKRMTLFSTRNIIIVLVALVVILGAGFVYYFQKANIDPNRVAQEELADVVEKVGKLIVLPEGETPTLATVSDPEKLRDQTFFARAKTGDKVLIFTNSKKAILYDPVANKIVEVAPVNLGGGQ